MVTSINEFKKLHGFESINEVRIPTGYFKVLNNFSLPSNESEWSTTFGRGALLEIDPVNRAVKRYNENTGMFEPKDVNYIEFMKPNVYSSFKNNTIKLGPEQIKAEFPKAKTKVSDKIQFTTSVKRFNKKAEEVGLEDGDKVKVTEL